MRSQQVYQALAHVPNRFALCRITAISLKKLHKAHTRPQDTISGVLGDIDRYKARRTHSPQEGNSPETKAAVIPAITPPEDLGLQYPVEPSIASDLVFAVD